MRALIVVLVLMLVLLLGALPCAAKIPEIPRFRIVGPSDGLPSTMVVAIHRDRAGYLWLGTLDGLVRYDGAGFRTWRHDPNDPASLPCNAVQALHIDALDRIWIGCGKTLSVMDAGRRQFRHYRTADYPLLKDGEIYSIAAFDGDIWAGTTSGALVRIDAGGTMSSVDLGAVDGDLDQAMVMNLAADNRQRLWIATSNGLAYYDGKHLRREYVPDEPNRQSAIFGLQWTGDRLWLGSESGLHVMGSNDQWQPLPWGTMFGSGNEFWGAVAAQDGEFWLGADAVYGGRVASVHRSLPSAARVRCRAVMWSVCWERPMGALGSDAWHWPGVFACGLEAQCRAQARRADRRCHLLQSGTRHTVWWFVAGGYRRSLVAR